jgi:hypothetical protein
MKTSTLVALGLASSPMIAFAGAAKNPGSITMQIDGVDYTLDIGAGMQAANDKTIFADGWALAYENAAQNGETIFDATASRENVTCHLHATANGFTLEQAKVGLKACLSLLK